jgi:hypothetical protein
MTYRYILHFKQVLQMASSTPILLILEFDSIFPLEFQSKKYHFWLKEFQFG